MPELLGLLAIGAEGAADVGVAAGLGAADVGAEAGFAAADVGAAAGGDIAAGGLAGADVAAAGADASLGLGGLDAVPGIAVAPAVDTPLEIGAASEGFGGSLPTSVFSDASAGGLGPSGSLSGAAPTAASVGVSPVGGFLPPDVAVTTGVPGTTISDVAAGDVLGGGATPAETGGAAAVSPAVPGETTLESGFSNFSQADAAAAPVSNPSILNPNPFTDIGNFQPPTQLDTPAGQSLLGGQPPNNSLNFGQGGLGQPAPITPGTVGGPFAPGVTPNVPDLIDPSGGGGFDFGSNFQGSGEGLDAQTTTIAKTPGIPEPPPPSVSGDVVSDVPGIAVDTEFGTVPSPSSSFFDTPVGTGASPLNTDFGSIPQSLGADSLTPNPPFVTNPVDAFDVTATAEGTDLFSGAGAVPQVPDIMGDFTSSGQFTASPLSEITTTGGFDPNVPGGFASDTSVADIGTAPDLFSDIETGPQVQPGGAYNPIQAPLPQQALQAPQIGPFETTTLQSPPGVGGPEAPAIPATGTSIGAGLPGGQPMTAAATAALGGSNPFSSLLPKNVNIGQLAGLGAAGFLLSQRPKVPAATNQAIANAGPEAALGEANIAQTQPTPTQQIALDKIQRDAINQLRQQYFSQGRDPNADTSFAQQAENVAVQTAALAAAFVQQANQLGVQELQGANSVLTAAGQQQLAVQTAFNNSLLGVATSLARLFGGSAASGGGTASGAGQVAAAA